MNALATKWGSILIKHRLNKIFGNNRRGDLKATIIEYFIIVL